MILTRTLRPCDGRMDPCGGMSFGAYLRGAGSSGMAGSGHVSGTYINGEWFAGPVPCWVRTMRIEQAKYVGSVEKEWRSFAELRVANCMLVEMSREAFSVD